MWNLMLELLRRADRVTQNRFERLQAQHGRNNATLTLMVTGAGIGATAMLYPYAVLALLLFMQMRAQEPVLVMLFLILYVAIGTVQGIWLGAACGAATAFRAQQQRQKAGIICWFGSLPYLLLVIWCCFHYTVASNNLSALLLLCGLPLLWALLLLVLSTRLLYKNP